ncbi:hypothetical protein [Legionella jordanis]|uniref:Uncharacterized protein n=1 Tax=Legionella jordanis TaxID=456 RepID=A0A0W0VA25_9GAMM|nr:hypothetical protein [Legionella jordanis]KTD16717.1 hypothetical protein Ljor_1023 [Legionella jordanis]RMX03753.1 hypothetical protein EAW55_05160 [Legionella jordanis]RMX22185.1 hypothetical protein EAS68_01265 [Legionella jordanis]VEH11814.1 Uncharacterised protein [Legionella jordanis]HAT8712876.1 hypothetical protein [Legionella jordanis]
MNRLTALLLTLFAQGIFLGILFVAFLLDPLLGLWATAFNVLIVSSFLFYQFFRKNPFKNCCMSDLNQGS